MVDLDFNYKGMNTIMQCKKSDKIKDICEKYCIKIQADIHKLLFIYSGQILNKELDLKDIINNVDNQNLKMNILVYDNTTTIEKDRIIKSKEIICPKCGELCLFDLNDYNIILKNCKNKHNNIITLNEFDKTQNINENRIKCSICNKNKAETYENKFYICGTCNKNICPICKERHNKEHKIIDYNNKNYQCKIHSEQYISYCDICKENLCMQCEMEHNEHKIITYREIIQEMNKNDINNKFKN
jgi:hypothetical protein